MQKKETKHSSFMNKSLLMGYFPTSIISLGTYPMSAVWCQRMTGKLGLGLLAPIVPSCMKPNGKELDVEVNVLQIFLHSEIIAGNVHWYWSRLWPELFSPLKKNIYTELVANSVEVTPFTELCNWASLVSTLTTS